MHTHVGSIVKGNKWYRKKDQTIRENEMVLRLAHNKGMFHKLGKYRTIYYWFFVTLWQRLLFYLCIYICTTKTERLSRSVYTRDFGYSSIIFDLFSNCDKMRHILWYAKCSHKYFNVVPSILFAGLLFYAFNIFTFSPVMMQFGPLVPVAHTHEVEVPEPSTQVPPFRQVVGVQ